MTGDGRVPRVREVPSGGERRYLFVYNVSLAALWTYTLLLADASARPYEATQVTLTWVTLIAAIDVRWCSRDPRMLTSYASDCEHHRLPGQLQGKTGTGCFPVARATSGCMGRLWILRKERGAQLTRLCCADMARRKYHWLTQ